MSELEQLVVMVSRMQFPLLLLMIDGRWIDLQSVRLIEPSGISHTKIDCGAADDVIVDMPMEDVIELIKTRTTELVTAMYPDA